MQETIKITILRHINKLQTQKSHGGKKSTKLNLAKYRQEVGLGNDQLFMDEGIPIERKVEQDYTIEDIIQNQDKLHVIHVLVKNSNASEAKDKDHTNVKKSQAQLLDECLKNKSKFEEILVEVDRNKKQREKGAQMDIDQMHKKLQGIKQQLGKIIPAFRKVEKPLTIDQVENIVKFQIKHSQNLMNQLKSSVKYTPNQMLKRSRGTYCTYLNQLAKINTPVIDFDKCKIQTFNNYKGQQYKQIYTKQSKIWQNVTAQKDELIMKASVDVAGFSPACLITAGTSSALGTGMEESKESCICAKSMAQIFYGVWVGDGYSIHVDNIAFNAEYKQSYTRVFEEYCSKLENCKDFQKERSMIQNQVKDSLAQLIQKYGGHIQIGCYVFGGKFLVKNQYTFSQDLTQQRRQQIVTNQTNAVIKGAGLCQYGIGAAQFSTTTSHSNANQIKTQDQSGSYTVRRETHTFTDNHSDWQEVMEHNMNHWKVLYKETESISLADVMNNPLNRISKNQGFQLFEVFTRLFKKVYFERFRNKQGKKSDSQFIICVVGKSGQGKSTFVNQLVGQSLDTPCIRSGAAKGQTTQVARYKMLGGNLLFDTTIIDTPGFFDNMKREKNMRQEIVSIIYQKQEKEEFQTKLKYVDCFVLLTKVGADDRLEIKREIHELESIFGYMIYDSLMIVINFPSVEVKQKKFAECLQVQDLLDIPSKNKSFNIHKQVTWNILQDPKTPTFRKWRSKFLENSRQFTTRFTSDDYHKYAEQRKRQNQQKVRKEQAKRDQQLWIIKQEADQAARKAMLETMRIRDNNQIDKFIKNQMAGFALVENKEERKFYVNLCKLEAYIDWSFFILFPNQIVRGFGLTQNRSRLMLLSRKFNIEEGVIEGYLVDSAEQKQQMALFDPIKNEQKVCTAEHGHTVRLQFEGKRDGLIQFCINKQKVQVYIRVNGKYLYVKDPQMEPQTWLIDVLERGFAFPTRSITPFYGSIVKYNKYELLHTANQGKRSKFQLEIIY